MVSKNEHALRSTCPLACALDVIGDHWTLLVVRDLLLLGKHEYREFLDSPEGISSNILSDRLEKLEGHGLLTSIPHPDTKRRKLYYLTESGKGLIHVLVAVAGWSLQHHPDSATQQMLIAVGKHASHKAFIRQTLADLRKWEQRYGIT